MGDDLPAETEGGGQYSSPADESALGVPAHAKPMLTAREQVAHLKARGVTFDLCSEDEAAEYLTTGNNYLRTASYRKLYPVQTEGARAGEYLSLDFGDLVTISSLDRKLRAALLATCIDVEHFAKMAILRMAEEHGEDGYAIVSDFVASMNHKERNRLSGGLAARGAGTTPSCCRRTTRSRA